MFNFYSYLLTTAFLLHVVTSNRILRSLYDESQSSSSDGGFWPSFDDAPVVITPEAIVTKEDVETSVENTGTVITTTTSASTTTTTTAKSSTTETTSGTTTVTTSQTSKQQELTFFQGFDSFGRQYPRPKETLGYSRGLMYNVIIVILGTIGVACLLAILFGCVVIARSSHPIIGLCRKQNNNNNNNNNQDQNVNMNQNGAENINNFSSANTIVSYLDRRGERTPSTVSFPPIAQSVSQPDLIDPILNKRDESIIYSTTSITDTSEHTRTSKLCNSGILYLGPSIPNIIEANVSPYAAVNIDDITSPNSKENFVNYNKNITIDDLDDGDFTKVTETSEFKSNNVTDNQITDEKEQNLLEEPVVVTDEVAVIVVEQQQSPVHSESSSNLSATESNKDEACDQLMGVVSASASASTDFNINLIKNLNNTTFSSTNTITTTSNPNSTFYSYRVDKPVKSNLKTNSYRIQAFGSCLQEYGGKTSQ